MAGNFGGVVEGIKWGIILNLGFIVLLPIVSGMLGHLGRGAYQAAVAPPSASGPLSPTTVAPIGSTLPTGRNYDQSTIIPCITGDC